MLNLAGKQGLATVTNTGTGGKQTIVIAAPKTGAGSAGAPTKFITTMPKLATSTTQGTQFIVVGTRPAALSTTATVTQSAGKSSRKKFYPVQSLHVFLLDRRVHFFRCLTGIFAVNCPACFSEADS